MWEVGSFLLLRYGLSSGERDLPPDAIPLPLRSSPVLLHIWYSEPCLSLLDLGLELEGVFIPWPVPSACTYFPRWAADRLKAGLRNSQDMLAI